VSGCFFLNTVYSTDTHTDKQTGREMQTEKNIQTDTDPGLTNPTMTYDLEIQQGSCKIS